ncbi:MAG: glycosyltransferase involved in cell wall biosynthesis [Parasphingorhabdus sp.]|jgi:glycosyltransferase involved in cell wall biosynthesis
MSDFLFSIITPTYNRAHSLGRVYRSICSQTCQDFEWVIVDDGSTDNTSELIAGWIEEDLISIQPLVKENGGKADALNHGVSVARGEMLIILDSDDELTIDALAVMIFAWNEIPSSERSDFIGVTGLCENQSGDLVGSEFPHDSLDSNAIEVKYKFKLEGEKFGFQRIDIIKQNPFPVLSDHSHVPEGIYWGMLARRFKTRYINKIVRIYHQSKVNDSLTNICDPGSLAEGNRLWHQFILNEEIPWLTSCLSCFVISAIHYSRFSFHVQKGALEQIKSLENLSAKTLVTLFAIAGYLVYKRDLLRMSE